MSLIMMNEVYLIKNTQTGKFYFDLVDSSKEYGEDKVWFSKLKFGFGEINLETHAIYQIYEDDNPYVARDYYRSLVLMLGNHKDLLNKRRWKPKLYQPSHKVLSGLMANYERKSIY